MMSFCIRDGHVHVHHHYRAPELCAENDKKYLAPMHLSPRDTKLNTTDAALGLQST